MVLGFRRVAQTNAFAFESSQCRRTRGPLDGCPALSIEGSAPLDVVLCTHGSEHKGVTLEVFGGVGGKPAFDVVVKRLIAWAQFKLHSKSTVFEGIGRLVCAELASDFKAHPIKSYNRRFDTRPHRTSTLDMRFGSFRLP